MNFDSELSAFQGAIISADNQHKFSRIKERGGNEEKISEIVNSIYSFLEEKQYIPILTEKAKSQMRKFTFYLLLNTDLPVLEEMVELPGIDMVVWTIPILTKCLACQLIWGLNMDIFLYENITFCDASFALEVVPPFIDSIKHCTPFNCLKKLKIISSACYRHICRLNFFNYHESLLTAILRIMYEHFLRCITYYVTPPNAAKLDALTEDDKYKQTGKRLIAILNLVFECLNIFQSTQKFESDDFEDMYRCTIKPSDIKSENLEYKVCEIQDRKIFEYIQKCNTELLDKCMAIVMEVSVDIFCAWSEFEENEKSMQKCIGELCFLLHSKLQKINSLSDHPLTNMLPQISLKPVDIHDIIKVADDDTIIENINNDSENKSAWIQALIEKDHLLDNMAFIECLIHNAVFITEDQSFILINRLLTYFRDYEYQGQQLKVLVVKLISLCKVSKIEQIVDDHFADLTLNDTLETYYFDDAITETFNKLIITSEVNVAEILTLFIQNPQKTYMKILTTAVKNIHQCDIMLKVMNALVKYVNHFYNQDTDASIIKSIQYFSRSQFESDVQRNSFVNFIVALKKSGIISEAKLLMLIIMPNLYKAMVDKEIKTVGMQVELLDNCYEIEEILKYRAPLLAMFSQVLGIVRWTFNTFTGIAPKVLDQVITYQQKLFNTYNAVIPDKELHWLKIHLKKLLPLNMYYYKGLWNPPGNNIVEIITGRKVGNNQDTVVILAKILCSATYKEWTEVWDSITSLGEATALDLFYKTMIVVTRSEHKNRTPNSWPCMLYCYRNLVLITKEKFLKEPLTDSKIKIVTEKVVTIVNLLNERDMEDASTIFLPLLSYIAGKRGHYAMDTYSVTDKIKNPNFAASVSQMFTNATC